MKRLLCLFLIFGIVSPSWAAISVVSHTTLTCNLANTTSAIDTTGASLLVVNVSAYGNGSPTITDSKGNTWHLLTSYVNGIIAYESIAYAWNPTVGTGHTFTFAAGSNYDEIIVTAFSGIQISADPLDGQNGAGGYSPQSGSITTTADGDLIFSGLGGAYATSATVDSPFTIIDSLTSGPAYSSYTAWYVQPSQGSIEPNWTPNNTYYGVIVAAFKAAGGGGGGGTPPTNPRRVMIIGN